MSHLHCIDLLLPFFNKYNQIFHKVYFLNWAKRSKICPECRNALTGNILPNLSFNIQNSRSFHTKVLVNKPEESLDKNKPTKNVNPESKTLRVKIASLEERNRELKKSLDLYKKNFLGSDSINNHLLKENKKLKDKLNKLKTLLK